MSGTADIVVPIVCIAVILLLACIQIPLTGFGPLWAKKLWTKIIRLWKKGDVRPWDWTPVEEGIIYLSTLPRSAAELQQLQGPPHNVGAVVSLNEGWEIVMGKAELDKLGMEWLHLPTPDYSSPDLHTVIRGVVFIDAQVKAGRAVLVHCNAGKGRSVVVALSFLLLRHFAESWDPVHAFEFVKAKRRIAEMRKRCGTHPQWRVVNAFERMLRKRAGQLPELREPTRPQAAVTVQPEDDLSHEQAHQAARGSDGWDEAGERGTSREHAREGGGAGGHELAGTDDEDERGSVEDAPRDFRGAKSFRIGARQVVQSPRLTTEEEEEEERVRGEGGEPTLPGTPFKDRGNRLGASDDEREGG